MERMQRIELCWSDWRSDAQPIGDTRETLERTEIIEISSLGWKPRAHPMYHARDSTYSVVKDLYGPKHTSTRMLFTESKFDINWLPLNAKRAAIFRGRPFLKPKIYSKMVRSHRLAS